MKKRAFIGTVAGFAVAMAGMAAAQDQNLSIGSGVGALSVGIYNKGNIRDSGTFDPGSGAVGNNIWNNCFFFYDGTTAAFADQNFSGTPHNNQLVSGTVTPTASSFTNNGITFGSVTPIANLNANLTVALTQPTPGNTAQIQWDWTFNNSGGTPINLRLVWFLDADVALGGGGFGTNKVAFTQSVTGYTIGNPAGAIAIGDVSGADVDLNDGILMDASVAPSYLFGLQDGGGPSFYWSNQGTYAANGIEALNQLAPAYRNIIQGDAGTDYLADAGADSGAAMEFNLVVPASGSLPLSLKLVFGIDDTVGASEFVAGVNDWSLY